ncbi:MAG TPA: protein kinase [Archangium sp.]|nr:protein kinase [Archangium sp.]
MWCGQTWWWAATASRRSWELAASARCSSRGAMAARALSSSSTWSAWGVGWRELFIMLRHEFPNVVRLLSHFKWPEEKPEYLVLVMEYVPGVTLYQWARDNNPCARELVEKLLPLARALTAVHAEDVFHRDLKGDNVLVRGVDGTPVLVDFGAGTMPGVHRVTRGSLAPANLRYRSPEAVAFFLREVRKPGERYDYSVKDELYALGVILST